MVNLVQDQVVKVKRYTSRPNTVYLWQEVNISIQAISNFQLVYDRGQCAEFSYFGTKRIWWHGQPIKTKLRYALFKIEEILKIEQKTIADQTLIIFGTPGR